MIGEKWMTSGRARLKARQNRTFAQRASLGRTRKRSNRAIEPSSEAKRHPSYNKRNTTGLTGTYSAWADPIARRAVVATVGKDTSRAENEVNAEYPPGTVLASERPARKIRDANRWRMIRRLPVRYTSVESSSSYQPSDTMYQQREVSPPFAYQQGRHAQMAGPPMQQQRYYDPMNGFASDREDPHYPLQGQHQHQHQHHPIRHETFASEQDRHASLHDQPQFGMRNYSTPGVLQRKAYYKSNSFEPAWGNGLVPHPVIPEQLQPPMVGHSSVVPQWHQGHPPEHGAGGFARFQKLPRSLNLERTAGAEYDLQTDYQLYDNNDFSSPPHAGFYDGELPFAAQESHSNVTAPFALRSQGNVPPFSVPNSNAHAVPPFSMQNSHTGIPPFAPKQVHRDAPFSSSNLTQSRLLDNNQGYFDDFEIPSDLTRPSQPEYPAGHRDGFDFPSDHQTAHQQTMVGNAGEPFVSPESEFGIPSEQNQQPPFQQIRQRQFLNAREEPNVLDDFAPFDDEPLQRNDGAAMRGIPMFKDRRSASLPAQDAIKQNANQWSVPPQPDRTFPSLEQKRTVETNANNKELAKKNEHANGAVVKQKLSKTEPQRKKDTGNEAIEFFQAWKGAPINSSNQDNLTQPNPPKGFYMISGSLVEDKRPNNKGGPTEDQQSPQNHRKNNLGVDVAGEKEHCSPRRAQSDDDSADDGRRPYGSRLPIRFFNEGIEIDVHGRPLAPKRSSIEQAAPRTKTGDSGLGSPNSDSLDGVEWNGKSSLWA